MYDAYTTRILKIYKTSLIYEKLQTVQQFKNNVYQHAVKSMNEFIKSAIYDIIKPREISAPKGQGP